MEGNEQKFVTKDELTEVITAVLFKFSDEVLLPAMQTISDENNERTDQKIDGLRDGLRKEMNERFDEHETLIYRLIENGEKTDRRLNSIEKKLDGLIKVENEDVCALGEDSLKFK